jgi:hypothetical protein
MGDIRHGSISRAFSRGAPRRILGKLVRGATSVVLIASSIAIVPAPVAYAATPGYYIAGDGSGGGASGDYWSDHSATPDGGAGGSSADSITGTTGDDVIFGDGSGGGGGGSIFRNGAGGAAGGSADTIDAAAGDDIVFGDGFAGMNRSTYNGGAGGFGGGGGGGGAYSTNGNGGQGGLLAGGGGAQTDKTPGTSQYGGYSGGLPSKPAGGDGPDNMWGGNSAVPTGGSGWFTEQSMGGSAYICYGAAGGAGLGGANSGYQHIYGSTWRYANGGWGDGNDGYAGSTTPVHWDDSTGALRSYVYGQRANIFSTTPGSTNGVGAGTDSIDGGPGSDELYGLGGVDTFIFDRDEAGASDVDTVWDFRRLSEADKLNLTVSGTLITATVRDALIAAQTTSGSDRSIVFSDGGSHSVTITVKNLSRDLASGDFNATTIDPPTVVTTGVSDVTSTTATGGGNVTSQGGDTVTARGVCWSTSANPTTSDSHTSDGSGTGSFTGSISSLSGNTRYHARAYATNSGGTSYGSDVSFYFDNGAPSTTQSGLAGSASTGWRSTAPTLTLTATDTLSGVSYTQYAVDGGGWSTYTVPVSVGGTDGSHPVTYRSADASGNIEGTHTGYVNLDSHAPTTTATGLETTPGAVWHTSSPREFSLSATDTVSGVVGTTYTVDAAAGQSYSAPVDVSGDGTHAITYASVDTAGNVETTHTGYVNIDANAPSLGVSSPSGWQTNEPVTVTANATDTGSGLAGIHYSVDGAEASIYTAGVEISAEGTTTLGFSAIDNVGHQSATQTVTVRLDSHAPSLNVSAPSDWQTTAPVTVTANATDTVSGLVGVRYSVNGAQASTYTAGVEVSTEGTTTLGFAAIDVAGNRCPTDTVTVHLDSHAPTTTATGLASAPGETWHTASTWPFSLSATDAVSGVLDTSYILDSGSGELYTAPVLVTGEGVHTVDYGSFDVAGNMETPHTGYVSIDSHAPTTTLSGAADGVWRTTDASITLTATDTVSGVGDSVYNVNGGGVATYTVPFAITTEGTTTVGYLSYDVAGNAESLQTADVLIDKTAPSSTATGPTGWASVPATVTITATDTVSGVAHKYYALNGGSTHSYSGPISITDDGTTTVSYWAVDEAGNSETTKTLQVTASTGPVITIDSPSGWASENVTVTVETASPVGVQSVGYRIGSGVLTSYTAPFVIGDEGSTLVSACSTDTNGMCRGETTATVRIDKTAPDTSDDHVANYLTSATIHLSAVDTLSGPDYTRYVLDSGSPSTGTAVTCSVAGAHTLAYASTDEAGNAEATKTVTFAVTARTTVSTRMSLVGSSRINKGRRYTLTTWMNPRSTPGSVRLTIQRYKSRRWRTVKTPTVLISAGKAVYRFKPGSRGRWRITSSYSGAVTATSVYRASSATKRFRVR